MEDQMRDAYRFVLGVDGDQANRVAFARAEALKRPRRDVVGQRGCPNRRGTSAAILG
jgi:hypothetical protein